MTLIRSTLLAATLALPTAAAAVPVAVYSADGAALFDGQFADFFDDGSDGIDIAVSVELVGDTLTGSLLVSDAGGVLLESASVFETLFDLGSGSDSVTLLFDQLAGSAAAQFGTFATAVFSFSQEDEDDGRFDPVSVTLFSDEPAPIPLPASAALLLLGMGALAGLSRRRRA